ncbi:hypothetical protein M5K25_004145 [Dendrobium thyrsiflorum]|uniref:HTH La-type RNA-binding domain-containing protein n=1 Tax=Dendrobium thyrsiflorum TaxID=117978 RepID=A0ABD0VLZ5_DENTH
MASAVDPTSPHSGRAIRNLSSSWSHVSRGEVEPNSGTAAPTVLTTPPSSPSAFPVISTELPGRSPRKASVGTGSPLSSVGPDHGVGGNAAEAASTPTGKKPAWNFPSNGAIDAGSIIDTASWPALSESAKFSPKSASSDSLKPLADGSVSAPLGSPASSPSSKHALGNQNTGASPSPQSPARQKSMKRGAVTGGSISNSGSSNGGLNLPSTLQVSESSQLVPGKQPSSGPFPKGLHNKNNSNFNNEKDHGSKAGGFSPQPYGGNEHQRGHVGGRRGSTGHHNNYVNKRDSDRVGYEWSHQNLGRDVHMQQPHQQRGGRPFQRPPSLVTAPFIAPPPPISPFSNHMGFPDFPSPVYYVAAPPLPESLRGVAFAPQQAPAPQVMFFPSPDPQRAMLLKQIEYYFSPENLCKDIFLRQNMDEKGWVPISLIAGFNRVKQLTNSVQYILDTIQLSAVVELQGEKIRKRNDWMTWLLHPADHSSSASGLQSPTTTSYEELEGKIQNVCLDLEDAPNNTGLGGSAQNKVVLTRSGSANKIVTCQ